MPASDLKKEYKDLYNPSANKVSVVSVPSMNFLMVNGHGDPNSGPFGEAVEALYAVSYAVKSLLKKTVGVGAGDYTVMPVEGLWWISGGHHFDIDSDKSHWKWTAMIMQPEQVTPEIVETALEETRKKKKLPILDSLRFEPFQEGLSAQILHVGPYSAEAPTIKKLRTFIRESGFEPRGKHHEIYLGDPRRSAPEKLRTVIRQPVE
jgi:hypothetical protein